MTGTTGKWLVQKAVVVLLLPCLTVFGMAQSEPQPPPPADPQAQLLSPQDLDNLVAPIALYPDPLLAQVLAAATYPLEIVEVQQWLQAHPGLRGQQLMDAAKHQNWDPSVQAMVAFPDVVTMLNRDVRWTTDLGNAFLSQQADVMGAVQRMRARAQANGRLTTTPQQTVTTQSQDGQTAIDIEPADPQVIYVPTYNPAYVWGPPVYGYYPPLWYPAIGFGFGFYPPCFLGGFLGGFGLGFGWGWGFGWFNHSLFVNAGFFNHYGFRGYGGYGFGGRGVWAHNPEHRLGVPYSNHGVANRFGGNARTAAGARSRPQGGGRSFNNASNGRSFGGASNGRSFSGAANQRSFNSTGGNRFSGSNRATSPGTGSYGSAGTSRSFSNNGSVNRGYSNSGGQSRSFAPASRGQSFSGQRYSGSPSGHFSARRSQGFSSHPSGGGGHFSSGGGHSGGGGQFSGGGGHSAGGGHSGGGGGHAGGGSHHR